MDVVCYYADFGRCDRVAAELQTAADNIELWGEYGPESIISEHRRYA